MSESIPTLQPHEFLQTLFGNVPSGFIEICYLAPEGVKLWPHTVVSWSQLPLGDINPKMPGVMRRNAEGYSCFFGCAVKSQKHEPEERVSEKTGRPYTFYPRGRAADATYITALWVDIDEPGEPGYLKAIGALVPPSIVVSTGGGWHSYWLLDEPLPIDDFNRDKVKQTLKGMALACGSDTAVADLARIMRLPGTVNTKPKRNNALCEVVDYYPARFHYEQFEKAYAPLARPPQQITRHVPQSVSAGLPKWVEEYLNTGAPEGERNKRLFAVARKLFDYGYSQMDVESLAGSRAQADGLTLEETNNTIASALRAPRGTPDVDRRVSGRMAAADRLLSHRGIAQS